MGTDGQHSGQQYRPPKAAGGGDAIPSGTFQEWKEKQARIQLWEKSPLRGTPTSLGHRREAHVRVSAGGSALAALLWGLREGEVTGWVLPEPEHLQPSSIRLLAGPSQAQHYSEVQDGPRQGSL